MSDERTITAWVANQHSLLENIERAQTIAEALNSDIIKEVPYKSNLTLNGSALCIALRQIVADALSILQNAGVVRPAGAEELGREAKL